MIEEAKWHMNQVGQDAPGDRPIDHNALVDVAEDRRALQFGLRMLLAWTAVVAAYLGILKMLPLGPELSILLAGWMIVVGAFRVVLGFRAAAFVSAIGGVLTTTLPFLAPPGLVGDIRLLLILLILMAIGSAFGFLMYGAVEIAFGVVNWADRLGQPGTDGEAARGE